jgi:ribosomal protein L34E
MKEGKYRSHNERRKVQRSPGDDTIVVWGISSRIVTRYVFY